MSTPPDEQLHMTSGQERRWFRLWSTGLALFFILVGGTITFVQWSTRVEENRRHAQMMDPAAPDPGVTAAGESSTAGAVPVKVGIYLERIPELSIKEATWTAVFDIWFSWQGDALKPAEGFVIMEGDIETREKLAESHEGGTHYERYRVVAKITKSFPLMRLPHDDHLLTIAIENGELAREKMVFVPDVENSSVSSRVKVPGYRMASWKIIEKPHSYKTTRGDPRLKSGTKSTYSQLRVGLFLDRDGWGLYFKMFQALYIALFIAFLACFIKPTDVDPRFGLGVGALFAAVANSYLVGSIVPDTGEMALADIVNGLGIVTILVTLVESTLSLYLYDIRGEQALSRRLDRVSFIIMLTGFIAANIAIALSAGW